MSDGTEIQWVDAPPPKRRTRQPKYAPHLPTLKENPGRWAVVATYTVPPSTPGQVSSVTYKHIRKLRAEGYEAEAAVVDGRSVLYARWLEQETDAAPTPIRPAPGKPVAKVKGYPCDHCEVVTDTPGALKHHLRRQHADVA